MDKVIYGDLCRDWDHLPVFVQDWYLDAVCEGGDWGVAMARDKDAVAAVLPYFLKRQGPFRYITMPPFVKHMGPFVHPAYREPRHEHRLLTALIDALPPHLSFKQNFHPGATDWLPFYWRGFRQSTRYTYRLDLSDLDAVAAGINRNMRRNLRKAAGTVRVDRDVDCDEFYRVNRLSFARQGLTPPYTFEQLRRHDEALAAYGARQMFRAVDDQGRVHSVACLIWDRQAAYYHLSGDDPALRAGGAGIRLIWEAIRFTREELGLRCFDFEGSMLPAIEAIRRQFGARQQPYSLVWKYNRRWIAWADRLRGRAPR